ncbi:DUF6308 family protein [Streptantibioticus parmotrematis]|uniref:DUF6308 family protein n=1 Tax=Streptantibioticus parmotrematis TaxID=2873249 RepID=UPI00340536F4
MDDSTLTVGGLPPIPLERAASWVKAYFDAERNTVDPKPYAYPAYDRLDTGSGPDRLGDGDLLAPTLLNAAPSIVAFYSLQAIRPRLEEALGAVPVDLSLCDAVDTGRHRRLLSGLFDVLDRPGGVRGVRLTTLSKVLHRKRPGFVPLYDRMVWRCYVGPGGPMRPEPERTWAEFVGVLAEHISDDIKNQRPQWERLRAAAPAGVSPLRLLDVVVWTAAKTAARPWVAQGPHPLPQP